jgi:hypothetical protein
MNPQIQPAIYKSTPDVTNAFNVDSAQVHQEMQAQRSAQRLSPGSYNTPIKMQNGAINDPTLAGYETPNFIHTKEKQIPQLQLDPQSSLQAEAQKDIQNLMSQFDNVHDKNDKIGQCNL